jgi:4-amino-4-deoxy-L-arabinose transferase-like glycosyltransferase
MIGVTLCALLPMNIYLSLFASNQPFVGLWSALAVFLTLRAMVDTRSDARYAEAVLIGLCLGLAILSKITGLLVVPGAVLGLAYASWRRQGRAAQAALVPAAAIAVMLCVCGWYFVRNMLQIGTPFSVGFSESLNTVWRQDPGFRAPGQFLRFGEALWYPVHAGFVSFWDSIYSTFWSDGFISSGQVPPGWEYISYAAPRPSSVPPWDFKFLGAATLLSIGPMLLIALGVVRSLARPAVAMDRGLLLCLFWIGTHLVAMVYLYLTLPMVSAGKAAYLLNVLPCFGLLAAHGLEAIERRPMLDAIATGAVAAWAVASYAAFFVR